MCAPPQLSRLPWQLEASAAHPLRIKALKASRQQALTQFDILRYPNHVDTSQQREGAAGARQGRAVKGAGEGWWKPPMAEVTPIKLGERVCLQFSSVTLSKKKKKYFFLTRC